MLTFDSAPHQVNAGFHLGRAPAVVFKQQRRVAADLPDARQLRQNLDLAFSETVFCFILQHIFHSHDLCIIQPLLFFPEAHHMRFFHFFREILEHFGLQPAQDERRRHLPEPERCLLIPVPGNGFFQLIPERFIPIQKTRHQIVENTPQFAQPVLNGGPGQRKTVLRRNDFYCLGRCGSLILDKLRLIQHLIQKDFSLIGVNIALQRIIRSNQNVPFSAVFDHLQPFRLIPVDRANGQHRSKAMEFLFPVIDQRSRANNERSADGAFLFFGQEHRNHLQCFPKAHFVRQDSAKAAGRQCPQPLIAVDLITAQFLPQFFRHLVVGFPHAAKVLDQLPIMPVPGRVDLLRAFQHLLQIQGTVSGYAGCAAQQFFLPKLQGIGQCGKFPDAVIDPDKITVLQAVIRLLFPVTVQNLSQL